MTKEQYKKKNPIGYLKKFSYSQYLAWVLACRRKEPLSSEEFNIFLSYN
jgi:hypothetical protein